MNRAIFKLLLILTLPGLHAFCQQEQLKTYRSERFSLQYPATWKTKDESGILNFYPEDDYGAITISYRSGIDFPLNKTRDLILEISEVNDNPANVKMTKKAAVTEFYYEHTSNNVKWITKAFRKKDDFYLVTVNCDLSRWDQEKLQFLKTLNSFKVK